MSGTPIQKDGSRNDKAKSSPSKQKNADQEGIDNPEDGASQSQYRNPRDDIMERIARANDEERMPAEGATADDMPFGEPPSRIDLNADDDDEAEPGLQYQQPLNEPNEEEPEGLPEEYANDPLAEFIEMNGDEPMFRTVVNGQQKLIPLEKARATIQKNMAADARLQEAATLRETLEKREQALSARERELAQKLQHMHEQPAQPSEEDAGLTDEQLTEQARTVVKELFTGTEDQATAKLADLLLKTRGAAKVATSVDPAQIAAQAVAAAREQISAEEREKDVKTGYKKFVNDYPDIAEDDHLFRLADGMTDEIVAEHPDWMPSEVMLEAGKRVREWVAAKAGKTGKDEETSEQSDQPKNDRTERKRQLRPVPRSRQGVQEDPAQDEEPQTPGGYLAEIRAARGQPI